MIAARASFGGPLWWPAAVGAACLPAFAAIGLGAGALLPSRFTAPAVAVGAFFTFALSTELITGSQSPWQVSPLVSAPWDLGPDAGIATFYPYQPDLAIAQLMFLAGLTITILAAIATTRGSGPARPRALAAGLAAAGLLTTATAVTLTGTGRLRPDRHDRDPRPCTTRPATARCRSNRSAATHRSRSALTRPYSSYLPTTLGRLPAPAGRTGGPARSAGQDRTARGPLPARPGQ